MHFEWWQYDAILKCLQQGNGALLVQADYASIAPRRFNFYELHHCRRPFVI